MPFRSSSKAEGDLDELFADFITASHILHHNGVLDAYGHISVRNPQNPSTFFMSCNMPPALISSKGDLVEYSIEDAEPQDPNPSKGYLERYIHSEILKRFPKVNSVIHSHSPDVLPYCIHSVPLKPTIHMAGFLGTEVPVFDITQHYQSGDSQDFLVQSIRLGEALAATFSRSQATYAKVGASIVNRLTGSHTEAPTDVDHNVVLMQNHGFSTAASSIEEAVYQAIFTQEAAKAQTTALTAGSAHFRAKMNGKVDESGNIKQASIESVEDVHYLNAKQATDSWSTMRMSIDRPWQLWTREVEVSPLYENKLRKAS